MNRTLPLSHVADAASASLSGGQAPRSWRRECAQRATRLRALSRIACWGDALNARAPGLTDTPLWGECLAELATQTPARAEEANARSRPSGATPRGDASSPARLAHTPGEFNRAPRQTSSRRTSAARSTLPPPLPRAFQQHAASVPGHDPQLSGLNRSAPGSREQPGEGQDSYFRAWPGARFNRNQTEPFNENQDAHFEGDRRAHTHSARVEFHSPETANPLKGFSSSVRADAETHESGEGFVTVMEVLSLRASHELLCRLAGRNGSSPVQNQKSSRVAPARHSRTAASDISGTAISKNYGAAPSIAEERQSNRPHSRIKTTPRATITRSPLQPGQRPHDSQRGHTPDAPVYRGGRVRQPDAAALHTRGRQWWSVLAARTAHALRRSGVLPVAPEQTGATLLTKQLFFTVNGETAPQDLLRRLAGGCVADSGAARQSSEQRGGGRQSAAPRPSQSETPQTFLDAGSNLFTKGGGSVALANRSPMPGLDSKQHGMSATAEASAPGVNTSLLSVNNYLSGAETTLAGAAASPVVAESLPPLLPSPLVGMPILPIALATAREGAREESRESAEDLDALAAKIKFILDEQARRHGIDV